MSWKRYESPERVEKSKDMHPISVIGVPVLDPQIVAFKMAEMMVDLRVKAGYPAVSRIGMWKKQPRQEFLNLRDRFTHHRSASYKRN